MAAAEGYLAAARSASETGHGRRRRGRAASQRSPPRRPPDTAPWPGCAPPRCAPRRASGTRRWRNGTRSRGTARWTRITATSLPCCGACTRWRTSDSAAAVEARMAPLAEGNGPYRASAAEIRALAALKRGETDAARRGFRALARDGAAPRGGARTRRAGAVRDRRRLMRRLRCVAPRRVAGRRRRAARRLRSHFQHLRRARAPLAGRAPAGAGGGAAARAGRGGPGGGPVNLPPIVENAEWAQAGGTISHAPGHPALGRGLAELWRSSVGTGSGYRRRLTAPPLVAGGTVYAMDAYGAGHGAGRGERAAALADGHAAAAGPRRGARRRHRLRGRAALRRDRPGRGHGDRSRRTARSAGASPCPRRRAARPRWPAGASWCRRWRTTCSRSPSRTGGGSGPTGRSRPPP